MRKPIGSRFEQNGQPNLWIIWGFCVTHHLPLPQVTTLLLMRSKCLFWLRGGVGGQLTRNLNWSKFSTGKFRPGIALTICPNQFHLPKNGRERLKLLSRMALKKVMEHEFPFGTFRPRRQDYRFKRSVATRNFPLKWPERSCCIYFPTRFSGNSLLMVDNLQN